MHDVQMATAAAAVVGPATESTTEPVAAVAQTTLSRPIGHAEVVAGLLLFAAVWLAHLSLTSLSAPVDNIEQLVWVRSLEWGYYKHPPLPTWLIWVPVQWFGVSAWASYGLGASVTLGSMWILWSLLRKLRGPIHANVALLGMLCITYYNGRLCYYNHDIVLLLLTTASAALCWQAFATRRLRWWFGLGCVLGLAALSKYQVAVTMVPILAFALQQRAWRDPVHRQGLLLAVLLALLIFSPHVEWLRAHDFGPVHYALDSSLGTRLEPPLAWLRWLGDQLFNRSLPALIFLLAVGVSLRRTRRATPAAHSSTPPADDRRARAFLLIWGTTPLLFTTLLGMAFGADLQLHWGTAFVPFVVPAVMELGVVASWNEANLGKALRVFLLVQALLLVLSHLTSPQGPAALRAHDWRAFDAGTLASNIIAEARTELGGPIQIVSSAGPEAGALALRIPERPRVLIGGPLDRSPWVSPGLVARCGILELGSAQTLPLGKPAGPAFPGLLWRVTKSQPGADPCPR